MRLGANSNREKDLPGKWAEQKEQLQGTKEHHSKSSVDEEWPKIWKKSKEQSNEQQQNAEERHGKHIDVTQLEHGNTKFHHEAAKYFAPNSIVTGIDRNTSTMPKHDHITNIGEKDTNVKTRHQAVSSKHEPNEQGRGEKGRYFLLFKNYISLIAP